MTFAATANAITYTGAEPVFVDCDEHALIDTERIEDAVTDATTAIVPVHLYGQPADMDPILEVAARHHLAVVEDCAQVQIEKPTETTGAKAYAIFFLDAPDD